MQVKKVQIMQQMELVKIVLPEGKMQRIRMACQAAKEELIECIESNKECKGVWGFFPQYEKVDGYPRCRRLHETLISMLPLEGDQLAFIRYAPSNPSCDIGGMHVDVDVGVDIQSPKERRGREIVRTLVNLHSHPRKLLYKKQSRDLLNLNKLRYEPMSSDIAEEVDIPPLEDNAVWMLIFESSTIPHVGKTGQEGHMLAAYGRWKEK